MDHNNCKYIDEKLELVFLAILLADLGQVLKQVADRLEADLLVHRHGTLGAELSFHVDGTLTRW